MVEWKKLGEVCTIIRGNRVTKGELVNNGKFPVISGGVTPMGFIDSYNREPNTITVSQYGTAGYVDFQHSRFWANDICYCVYPEKDMDNKYLWYVLKGKQNLLYAIRNTDAVPYSLPIDTLKSVSIPIPSLSEQTRIVGILDTFTSAIDNLKEQIAQRRKQYEYYRDQLLDLEGKPGVEMKKLGEVCEIKGRIGFRGYTREDQVEKGEGAISLSPGNIINGIIDYNSCTYITWKKYEESPEIMTLDGDIILCKTASVGKVAMVMNLLEKATINPQLVVLKNIKITNKYLYYLLSTFKIQAILKGLAGIGSVPNISQAKLADIKICISPSKEQQRIVSILDTFEASIQNLEAQLKEREKQYEYYRNKLLTFE